MWKGKKLLRTWLLSLQQIKLFICSLGFMGILVALFTLELVAPPAWAAACSGTSCTSIYFNWAASSSLYDTYIILNNLSSTGPNSARQTYTCDICYWNTSNILTFYREVTVPNGSSGTSSYVLTVYSSMNPNGYGPLLIDCTSGANVSGYASIVNTSTGNASEYIVSTSSESGGYCAALA